MKIVILQGEITIPEEDLTEVKRALPLHIKLTREEPGCLNFQVTESPDKPGVYSVYEEFINEEAFRAHQDRVKSSTWGQVSKNVARDYSISFPSQTHK